MFMCVFGCVVWATVCTYTHQISHTCTRSGLRCDENIFSVCHINTVREVVSTTTLLGIPQFLFVRVCYQYTLLSSIPRSLPSQLMQYTESTRREEKQRDSTSTREQARTRMSGKGEIGRENSTRNLKQATCCSRYRQNHAPPHCLHSLNLQLNPYSAKTRETCSTSSHMAEGHF